MKRALALLGILAAAVLAVRANAFEKFTVPPTSADLSRDLTTETVLDSVTSTAFYYSAKDTLWLSPIPCMFGRNGSTHTGAMTINGSAMTCDTTHTGPNGFAYPESTVLLGWRSLSTSVFTGAASPNCSTQVFRSGADSLAASGPDLISTTAWAGSSGEVVAGVKYFAGPNERWMTYIKPKSSGAANPTQPQIWFRLYRFRRP